MESSEFKQYRQNFEFANSPLSRWHKYSKDIIPLWVADMDFSAPPAVIEAITKRAKSGLFGYSSPPKSLYNEVVHHCARKFHWQVLPEEIVFMGGVVAGLTTSVLATTKKNDSITIAKPVYPPFFTVSKNLNRHIVDIPMKIDNQRLIPDYNFLNSGANEKVSNAKLLIWCNPHNPGGTIHNYEETIQIAKASHKNNWFVCSDEIHAELVLDKKNLHLPFAKVLQDNPDEEFSKLNQKLITLMSPNKAYNIPSLGMSYAIISNEKLRRKFKKIAEPWTHFNVLTLEATLACLQSSDNWLESTKDKLLTNLDLVVNWGKQLDDAVIVTPPQASYLVWIKINNRKVIIENIDLEKHFAGFGVGIQDGRLYGEAGFIRLNIGTTVDVLSEALLRMSKAVDALA